VLTKIALQTFTRRIRHKLLCASHQLMASMRSVCPCRQFSQSLLPTVISWLLLVMKLCIGLTLSVMSPLHRVCRDNKSLQTCYMRCLSRLSLKVPPTHRPCRRPYPLPTHWLLTNDPQATGAPPAAPTQRPSTLDRVFYFNMFVVIN